jgi:hypothetical protein
MLFINRLFMIGLLSVGIAAATTAQAANQMFTAEWRTDSFGNECVKDDPNQPECVQPPEDRTGPSEFNSVWGIPQNIQCNNLWPRCPFQSTPTGGAGDFNAIGGPLTENGAVQPTAYCTPWNQAKWGSETMRPAKGGTVMDGNNQVPPLYRNYVFFTASTPNAQPNTTYCNATSTSSGGPGKVMRGSPVTGTWTARASTNGGFSFEAAPLIANIGLRVGFGTRSTASNGTGAATRADGKVHPGAVGDFQNIYPYIYSYTYATLRNDVGVFGIGQGPGNATLNYDYGQPAATVRIKQGKAKFGGTMRMLGAYTTKVCYFRQGGCSLGQNNWRYDAVGATAYKTGGGALLSGYEATYKAYYYHTQLMQKSTITVEGERFPWTTGSVTLKATGRGPHKTVHYGQGYDNRDPVTHKGTIQMVTPVLTRWLQPCCKFETGGVGVLRIKFVPEPQTLALLLAGVSLLGVGYRMRGR